ncbi:MAG: nucleoside diphosphate kinase regulator [Rhizobiales bacterium]|nr:nucleoside diphosphate kinase regulator [Hyphomicrobiales bacterium]
MRQNSRTLAAPAIMMSDLDQECLTALATAALERVPEVAEELLTEIARATVVEPGKLPAAIVRMGSTVEFSSDGGARRRVTLVYPGEADIAEGRISILTPVGAALIGLSEGQTIVSSRRDGREQHLTVLSVAPANG